MDEDGSLPSVALPLPAGCFFFGYFFGLFILALRSLVSGVTLSGADRDSQEVHQPGRRCDPIRESEGAAPKCQKRQVVIQEGGRSRFFFFFYHYYHCYFWTPRVASLIFFAILRVVECSSTAAGASLKPFTFISRTRLPKIRVEDVLSGKAKVMETRVNCFNAFKANRSECVYFWWNEAVWPDLQDTSGSQLVLAAISNKATSNIPKNSKNLISDVWIVQRNPDVLCVSWRAAV